MNIDIDISETELFEKYPEVLQTLLRCHSRFDVYRRANPQMSKDELDEHLDEHHIIWATSDYESHGEGYGFHDQITVNNIIGENGKIIQPRVKKSAEEQTRRVKDKAEVFTPSWVCNAQNNLVDEAWFGRKDVFNREYVDDEGKHRWEPTPGPITFSEGKSWQGYVSDNRLEITCGEAPYLVSRYDTTTGEYIPLNERIGLLDRKLRVVSENCHTSAKWLKYAREAYMSTYGFEWQGDNLLLAREAMLVSFIEYYSEKFNRPPVKSSINGIAYIISWNLFQMDGLKFVIPESCHEFEETVETAANIFEPATSTVVTRMCPGCQKGDHEQHNGIYAKVRDWRLFKNNHKDKNGLKGKDKSDQYFIELLTTKQ